jgi:hypothetical protein
VATQAVVLAHGIADHRASGQAVPQETNRTVENGEFRRLG